MELLGDRRWLEVFQPRKGHLLEVDAPEKMAPLAHGLMEIGYAKVRCAILRCARPKFAVLYLGPNHRVG